MNAKFTVRPDCCEIVGGIYDGAQFVLSPEPAVIVLGDSEFQKFSRKTPLIINGQLEDVDEDIVYVMCGYPLASKLMGRTYE